MKTNNELDEVDLRNLLKTCSNEFQLEITKEAIFEQKGNYLIILAREFNYRYGINNGDLKVGVVRYEKECIDGIEVYHFEEILPFTKKLLYARFLNDNKINLCSYEEGLHNKIVSLNENGTLDLEDIEYTFEDYELEEPTENLRRVRVLSVR